MSVKIIGSGVYTPEQKISNKELVESFNLYVDSYNQKNKVIDLLKNKGFYINKTIKDYAKNDRCVISTKI